jgi:hypothetical protein
VGGVSTLLPMTAKMMIMVSDRGDTRNPIHTGDKVLSLPGVRERNGKQKNPHWIQLVSNSRTSARKEAPYPDNQLHWESQSVKTVKLTDASDGHHLYNQLYCSVKGKVGCGSYTWSPHTVSAACLHE